MKIIKCPETYTKASSQEIPVFMAGGISNCPDWQAWFPMLVGELDDVILINPRRDDFDTSDPEMTKKQITWEHSHLTRSYAILFWFPEETLCPITLYELGRYASIVKPVFVGCHPGYQRKADVDIQLSLIRPDIIVRDNMADLAQDLRTWIKKN